MHVYTFDVKMFASITVRAETPGEARRILDEVAETIETSIPNRTDVELIGISRDEPNNDPITEVDGEPVDEYDEE
jgi:hypothetical protein